MTQLHLKLSLEKGECQMQTEIPYLHDWLFVYKQIGKVVFIPGVWHLFHLISNEEFWFWLKNKKDRQLALAQPAYNQTCNRSSLWKKIQCSSKAFLLGVLGQLGSGLPLSYIISQIWSQSIWKIDKNLKNNQYYTKYILKGSVHEHIWWVGGS